jgi:hypothetical protein
MFSRTKHVAPFALLLTLGVAACGSDAPTAPAPGSGVASTAPTLNLAAGFPFTATPLDRLLLDPLRNALENAAPSRFDNIEKTYDDCKLALAQKKALELVLWIETK